jgi:hypothetical protein
VTRRLVIRGPVSTANRNFKTDIQRLHDYRFRPIIRLAPGPIIWLEIRLLRSAPIPLSVASIRSDQDPSV